MKINLFTVICFLGMGLNLFGKPIYVSCSATLHATQPHSIDPDANTQFIYENALFELPPARGEGFIIRDPFNKNEYRTYVTNLDGEPVLQIQLVSLVRVGDNLYQYRIRAASNVSTTVPTRINSWKVDFYEQDNIYSECSKITRSKYKEIRKLQKKQKRDRR